jgi:hypothetical protein
MNALAHSKHDLTTRKHVQGIQYELYLNSIPNGNNSASSAVSDVSRYVIIMKISTFCFLHDDHICGVVVRVLGYGSRGLGSIPVATRSSEV